MIIQFNTCKTDIVLVKVPELAENIQVHNDILLGGLVEYYTKADLDEYIDLPPGDWQIVGNPFDLSEEQCKPLFNHKDGYGLTFELPQPYRRPAYFTAIAAWSNLLNHLKVYQVNPMGSEEPDSENYVSGRQWNHFLRVWRKLEERTGNWILLTAVKA